MIKVELKATQQEMEERIRLVGTKRLFRRKQKIINQCVLHFTRDMNGFLKNQTTNLQEKKSQMKVRFLFEGNRFGYRSCYMNSTKSLTVRSANSMCTHKIFQAIQCRRRY